MLIILIREPGTENSWGLFLEAENCHPRGTAASPEGSLLFSLVKGAPTLCFPKGLGRGSRQLPPQGAGPALWRAVPHTASLPRALHF